MKRYRILNFFIDTTRNILRQEKFFQQEEATKEYLKKRFGELGFEGKYKRYMQLKKPPLTIITEFYPLLEAISEAYVMGYCYPALTGACCLGERIFNIIIFRIASYYKSSSWYKEIYKKGSINDWKKTINILKDGNVLYEDLEGKYHRLLQLRTDSVHYQSKDQDALEMSLEAINIVNYLIEKLFGLMRKDILLVFDVPGEIYIRKKSENNPFVKEFYIPCSSYVGYKYKIENIDSGTGLKLVIKDDNRYDRREISDQEFVKLRIEFKNKKPPESN